MVSIRLGQHNCLFLIQLNYNLGKEPEVTQLCILIAEHNIWPLEALSESSLNGIKNQNGPTYFIQTCKIYLTIVLSLYF